MNNMVALNGGGHIRRTAAFPEWFHSESENSQQMLCMSIEAVRRISPG